MKKYAAYGIGNAMVDIIIELSDADLSQLNIPKGSARIIEESESKKFFERFKNHPKKIVSGGSTANTFAALGHLGIPCLYCGCVGNDEFGDLFEKQLIDEGVTVRLARSQHNTGHVFTFVTPDGQRSFAGCFGAAREIHKGLVTEEDVEQCAVIYIEGYLLEHEAGRESAIKAMDLGKRFGAKTALDIGSPHLIAAIHRDLKTILKTYVDILFLNEDEAKEFTGQEGDNAVQMLRHLVKLVILKLGDKGSLVCSEDSSVSIPCFYVKPLDTTGAGDLFAAGFLYGLAKGKTPERAAHIGSYVASKIVTVLGGRLEKNIKNDVEEFLKTI
ncbi:adenosine kinase [Candidatus Woesearchaeota archaeon]|nr:adenosine kinase [Candidatus Woesearchaeota archaeon]